MGKYIFHWEKLIFEHLGNSVHTVEILTLGKVLNIYINYLMFYTSRQHDKWKHFKFKFNNEFTMNGGLDFSVTRNDYRHVLICRWLYLFLIVSYWGQVVEMNFGSISFDKLLKIISFPAGWVIYNEDSLLLMYYHTGINFPKYKILKTHKHLLKYKILEEWFDNSSSEAADRDVLWKNVTKILQYSHENTCVEISF